jgi:hypothetical protein
MRAEVQATQQRVHQEILPRLDKVNASCDACDVTLRSILSALRCSTAGAADAENEIKLLHSQAAVAGAEGEENVEPSCIARLRSSAVTGAASHAHGPMPTTPSCVSQRVEHLEEQLAALTRNVELQQRKFHRQCQQQARELAQVRHGVAQMEECKDQLLVVLRQLQLDKVTLLQALAQRTEEPEHGEGSSFSKTYAAHRGATCNAGAQNHEAATENLETLPTDQTALSSLETTVRGLEVLMNQEREAREAQIQELTSSLTRLEQLATRFPADAQFVRRPLSERKGRGVTAVRVTSDATPASWQAQHSHGAHHPSRELSYSTGGMPSPVLLAKRRGKIVAQGAPSIEPEDKEDMGNSKIWQRSYTSSSLEESAVVLRDRLLRFYALYDPRMIPAVAEVVRQFKGPQEELLAALEMDYDAYGYFSRDGLS